MFPAPPIIPSLPGICRNLPRMSESSGALRPLSLLLFFTGKALSARRVPTVGLRSLLKSCVCPLQTHSLALSSPFCFLSCADPAGTPNYGLHCLLASCGCSANGRGAGDWREGGERAWVFVYFWGSSLLAEQRSPSATRLSPASAQSLPL